MKRDITSEMEHFDEELKDAKKYAKCAVKYKLESPERAKLYAAMSADEVKHAGYFYDFLNKDTADGRASNEYADAMWSKVHSDYLDKVAEIKLIWQAYEGKV